MRTRFFLLAVAFIALAAIAFCQTASQNAAPSPAVHPAAVHPKDVLIKNATVMTVTHGKLEHASVLLHDGKIAAFGASVQAPSDAEVIDATGKFVTRGLVDCHSHIAMDDDVNEATSPITPQVRMMDAFDSNDKAIYRILAGGVTTSLLLHGSANMIGGQAVGALINGARVALTGQAVAPSLFAVMLALGREKTIARLLAVEHLSGF